jgi:hypothetical protein
MSVWPMAIKWRAPAFAAQVHIFINSKEFVIDLFVIPLEGYDMVLGVQWLRTLKPILWDFAHARMSCWRDDHRIVW